jgi:putative thioredoxin
MAGAVDLAAVKARNEAASRAAESPPPPAGQYVVEVTEQSFQTDVLDRSFQLPVVIDVRSERSPASQQLSALLEKLAAEADGAWLLARIDIDANMRVAQALQVQAVPTVFAVLGGQLVPGFEGALPEPQLREFLGAVAQAAGEAGLPGAKAVPTEPQSADEPAEEPDDPRFVAAEEALQQGDYALAAERYQAIIDAEPANTEAAHALGQVRLLERVESLDPDLAARADAAADDVDAQLAAADLAFSAGDADAAFARLTGLLARTSGNDRDTVRERLLELFDLLGADDPRVAPARRDMARVLF